VEVGPRGLELAPGDAVVFPGDVPHGYANPGSAPTRFVLTVYEPGVGAPGSD
jgi:quercetin dioxygenase-like cupin family protein